MLKKITITIVAVASATCYAETALTPISAQISRVVWAKPDPLELSYIGIRCGALNTIIGSAMEYQASPTPQNKQAEKVYKADGEMFRSVGFDFGFAGQQGDKHMLKQYEDLLKYYGKEWQDNLRLNNMPWTPLIQSDVGSCESIKAKYQGYKRYFDKQYSK